MITANECFWSNGALSFCHIYLPAAFAAANSRLANQLHRNVAINIAN